jgi:hypothetical protein
LRHAGDGGNKRRDLDVTAAQLQLPKDELDIVEQWRVESLMRAGYDEGAARQLAARPEIDLHAATDLLHHGCSPELALQILL